MLKFKTPTAWVKCNYKWSSFLLCQYLTDTFHLHLLVTRPNVLIRPKVVACYYYLTILFTPALRKATSKQPALQVNLHLKLIEAELCLNEYALHFNPEFQFKIHCYLFTWEAFKIFNALTHNQYLFLKRDQTLQQFNHLYLKLHWKKI